MNNYHLYEEIGKGKFSTVYKGRKRYTIRYVAVKSIEKSRREKVMTEVSIMSQLKQSNVVSFINWYETRNHLWIIFEYCAGGDLMRLLKQDGRLPEDQVRLFGRDITAGLLHVHANGIIYSDLKPANLLCDEEGTLKLCDFGHSQRLADIERALLEKVALPRRGTPHYMAPELLQDGGMHSFSSDLWALGCVLHEMLVGRPPFHSSSFQDLLQMVLHDPTPVPGGSSAGLQALLTLLLRKSPLDRGEWPAVRVHAFWQGRIPGQDAEADALPLQPHLEELRHAWARTQTPTSPGAAAAARVSPSAAAAGGAAATASFGREASARFGPAPRQALPETGAISAQEAAAVFEEPEAETETLHYAARNVGSRPATPAAQQAAIPAATMSGVAMSPAAAAYPPGSLRARLGAAGFARVAELVTSTETSVKPISRNPQIEEPEPLESTPADLPFAPLRLEEICSRSHAEAEVFFSKVYKWVAQGSLEQKIGAIKYLENISCDMQVADLVANSQLLPLVLRMLHARRGGDRTHVGASAAAATPTAAMAAAAPPLRARLLSLIGQLLRHATFLDPAVAELGLFDMLLDGLRERDVIVRRRCSAALGELLFYVATQPTPSSPSAQKGSDGQAAGGAWQVKSNVLHALVQMVSAPGEDEIVQHYVAKTIENITTQCPAIAQQWFFSVDHETLLRGLRMHVRRGSYDPFRHCCLAASAHLLRGQPESGHGEPQLPDPDLIAVGFQDLAPLGVPHSLQLVATVLFRVPSVDVSALALPANVVDLLVGVASQPRYHLALRGRAMVLLALLCALDGPREARHLRAALDRSLVAHVERLGREKDRFVEQCVAATVMVMDVVTINILQALAEGLRQLVTTSQPAASLELAGALVQVIPVFLHLLSSATFCGCVFSSRALPLLGQVGELCACAPVVQVAPDQAPDPLHQLQPLILMVMEGLATQQALLLEHSSQVVRCVLSALAGFLPNSRSDVRLLALKGFSDIAMILLNDSHVFDPIAERPSETTLLLESLLCSRVLPLLHTLLSDEPPSPSCAIRLLATLLSRSSAAAYAAVRELALAPRLLAALEGQHGLTVHACLLSCCLLWGGEVRVAELAQVGVLDAVNAVLVDAAEAAAGNAAQLDLALVDAALCTAEEALSQARVPPSGGANDAAQPARELGRLSRALPSLAALCAPLAHAKLGPLLDRATMCCQHLVDIARLHGVQDRRGAAIELSASGLTCLLDSLAAVAKWRLTNSGSNPDNASKPAHDAVLARTLQRRLLAVLAWAVTVGGASAETRADLASGVEQLLRDRVLGEDPAVASDARSLIAAAVGRGAA